MLHAKKNYLSILLALLVAGFWSSCNSPITPPNPDTEEPGTETPAESSPKLDSVVIKLSDRQLDAVIAIDDSANAVNITLREPADLALLVLELAVPEGSTATTTWKQAHEALQPFVISVQAGEVSKDYSARISLADNIAKSAAAIGGSADVRLTETDIARFCADAMLWYASFMHPATDFAFINAGSIRSDLAAGTLGLVNFSAVLPFPNKLTVVSLTGSEIVSMVNHASKNFALGGYGAVSKNFSYTVTANDDGFAYAENIRVNGSAIDPAATYTVALSDFLVPADAGAPNDGYEMLRGKTRMVTSVATTAEIGYAYANSFGLTGAVAPTDAPRTPVDVSKTTKHNSYLPVDGSNWYVFNHARFMAYHRPDDGYRYEIRVEAGTLNLTKLGRTINLPPYVTLSGGWTDPNTKTAGTVSVITGGRTANGSWSIISATGSGPRQLEDLTIDLSGFTKDEIFKPDTMATFTETEVEYIVPVHPVVGVWYHADGVRDLVYNDGTVVRFGNHGSSNLNAGKRGSWRITTTADPTADLLNFHFTDSLNEETFEWDDNSMNETVLWSYAIIGDRLYRGGFTRKTAVRTDFYDTFIDVMKAGEDAGGWLKRAISIDEFTGEVTMLLYANTDSGYVYDWHYQNGEGTWTPEPVATMTFLISGLPEEPEPLVIYEFEILESPDPAISVGPHGIMLYNDNHIAIDPDYFHR